MELCLTIDTGIVPFVHARGSLIKEYKTLLFEELISSIGSDSENQPIILIHIIWGEHW